MPLVSRLRIESVGRFLTVVFYAIAGIILFVVLPFANFPPQVAIMGMISLITAYGLLMKRSWAIYAVIMSLLTTTTFALYMLYFLLTMNLFFEAGVAAYLILTWVATTYISAKRKTLAT